MTNAEHGRRGLTRGRAVEPNTGEPRRLPPAVRKYAETARNKSRDRIPIVHRDGEPVDQSPPTEPQPTGPGGDHPIVFVTYTPAGPSGLIPPDSSGADSPSGVVLFTGNCYMMSSTDGGLNFTQHDSTTFLPAANGNPVDQVMIYVPHRDLFAWIMQHRADPTTGDGMFRLAVAKATDLRVDVEGAWTCYDYTSSDLGVPGVATDRQDLAYSEERLYLTTNLVGKGRVVMSLPLDDLVNGGTVTGQRTDPLDAIFTFSDLSQQNRRNVHSVAIASNSSLRVMTMDDASASYGFHDVTVGQFPQATDLVSLDPNGVDWLTRGVANVSASVIRGGDLWVAWDAAASAAGDSPSFPQPHVRLARIDLSTWTTVEERQVWHPDYAYAYGCLAVGPKGELGYGVAVGGKATFPNACFGILGDYVVYYRDASTATAGANSEARWGDYITVRPSTTDGNRFAALGYWTTDDGGSGEQHPYYLAYGRP